MYREKSYRVRSLDQVLEDIDTAAAVIGPNVRKVFVADGDALGMPISHWEPILLALSAAFPSLKRVSCYAMAENILEKDADTLNRLRQIGLSRLYIGPESGDSLTLKRIAKGASFEQHVEAADKAHAAGMEISVIALLGVGGIARSREHAEATGRLVTAMNPEFFAALTTTIVEGTPLAKMAKRERFQLPTVERMLEELKEMVVIAAPTNALFRTNHASNYLPLHGRLPHDRDRIVQTIDMALAGNLRLRPEWTRGL